MTQRRPAPRRDLLAILGVGVLFLVAWQAIVVIGDYPPFLLPPPGDVFGALTTAIGNGIIWPHFVTTFTEVVLGLMVGVTAGLLTGFVLARWHVAERLLSPYIVAAQATPILALDVYEHAYWFDFGRLRAKYIEAFFANLDWSVVEQNLVRALAMQAAAK